jgi:hypothetical protein
MPMYRTPISVRQNIPLRCPIGVERDARPEWWVSIGTFGSYSLS